MTKKKEPKATGRDINGRLMKGFSGNPSGRPLSDNIPKEVIAEVKKLKGNKEKVEFWDKYLLENPRTTIEVRQVIALIRDSYTPKLKNVETTTKVDTKIEISWLITDNKSLTSDNTKMIDGSYSHIDTEKDNVIDESTGISTLNTKDEAIREHLSNSNDTNMLYYDDEIDITDKDL